MKIKLELIIDVGDNPRADSDSYQIHQWGSSEPLLSDLDHIESTLLDIIEGTLCEDYSLADWQVADSHVLEVE